MSVERVPILGIHPFGKRCRVGFVAGIPSLRPGELAVGRAGAGAGLGHQVTDLNDAIKVLRFSKVVLEMPFSISYHAMSFDKKGCPCDRPLCLT